MITKVNQKSLDIHSCFPCMFGKVSNIFAAFPKLGRRVWLRERRWFVSETVGFSSREVILRGAFECDKGNVPDGSSTAKSRGVWLAFSCWKMAEASIPATGAALIAPYSTLLEGSEFGKGIVRTRKKPIIIGKDEPRDRRRRKEDVSSVRSRANKNADNPKPERTIPVVVALYIAVGELV